MKIIAKLVKKNIYSPIIKKGQNIMSENPDLIVFAVAGIVVVAVLTLLFWF